MICEKVTYNTAKEASKAASGTSQRKKDSISYYKCPECNLFHLRTARKKYLEQPREFKIDAEEFKYEPKNKLPEPDPRQQPRFGNELSTEKIFAHLFKLNKK